MIKTLFPYFGSKKRVVKDVWSRFGKIENFIEPFAGSLAVLLGNPNIPKIETINDKDTMVSNFWRASIAEPDKVAEYADYPVLESDLHARHRWLISSAADELKHKINHDPFFYDTRVAGWWVCESSMARKIGQLGGLGIIHRMCSVAQQNQLVLDSKNSLLSNIGFISK